MYGQALFDLTGRRVLVTGASRGIGAQLARGFAAAGARVALTARSRNALRRLATDIEEVGGEAVVVPGDLSTADGCTTAVEEAVAALGGLDVLLHNAGGPVADEQGVMQLRPVLGTSDDEWAGVLDVNLMGAVRLLRGAHPFLAVSPDPSVTIMSSVAGLVGVGGMEAYGAAKAAQMSLVRSLGTAWGRSGIRVNALAPGWVSTDMTSSVHEDQDTSEAVLAGVPQHRWADPSEVVGPALFLASPAASFMTGQTLVIDGGLVAHPAIG
ncbi:NAD(P)-dependent dehydrogenase, short-chain alcohol dehydrogenase family [Actinopolyspora lacussalsi subsp. righensis]|uniref:NAD(P)-dependent dehydrogenase, short-chain alcohol dehydrogenase family n=1 Tax=Actinopolyspora righensis TaxID=995060 RepID=A0A1I6XBH0_9ACTN|nr:SDR family NAD(P)-dependent oxidoreductase [Actinopolyspora righensis]SFT35618.1 NAD(P)-dependent dehydrogenase, short-chain alcohol dehydrogenase family [Actinopolyspora righensis]